MRSIAYVTTTFPTIASFLEGEVRRLVRRGVHVRVLTLRPVGREYQPEHAELIGRVSPVGSPLGPVGWVELLRWLLRRPGVLMPEVVRMLWASRFSLYAAMGHLAYLPAAARVASIVERERIEWIHGAWAHFPASVAYLAARLTARRFSMAAHAGADLYRTRAFLAHKVRAAEFTVACVRRHAEMLRELAGPAAHVAWIYHGVDLTRFDGRGRERDGSPLLLAVGRLSPPKGFDVALHALRLLARHSLRPRLVVVGDGPERARLERLARKLVMGAQVEFRGTLFLDELVALYRRAWVLVAPSRVMPDGRRDGIPNVLIEAMAMGVPCVGTQTAGLDEVIQPGETGVLCEPEDPAALAAALEGLLRDPGELDRMGAMARLTIARAFDAERNFDRVWDLFHSEESMVSETARREALGG